MTLYKQWQTIADRYSEDQALLDWKTGRSWTFGELQGELDRLEPAQRGTLLFPNGWEIELIFETLRAWRDGVLLCPVDGASPDVECFSGVPENIVHVKLTSGSTAAPKLILFDGDQLAADAANIVDTMGLKSGWPNLGVISMAHSYGFSNLVTPLLLHGVPLVWVGDPLPGVLSSIFDRTGESYTLPAVPAMWRTWLEAGVIDRDAIKLAISAGAPLSLELESRIYEETGVKVHNFYGSSECGGIAYDRGEHPRKDKACVGTAMENVVLKLRDSDNCLVVRSKAVGEGYWPEVESDSVIQGDEFVTMDLAEIDEVSGEISLLERIGEIINVAGRKVSPVKIEDAILVSDSRIRCCVVFGVPSEDAERVEEVVACVSVEDQDWDEVTMKSLVLKGLESYERPRHWWICQDLKTDNRGKISRQNWREKFLKKKSV